MVGGHIAESVGGQRSGGDPVDQHLIHMITRIGNDVEGLAGPACHGDTAGGIDTSVRPGAGGDGEAVLQEARLDGVAGGDVVEDIAAHHAHRNAVYQHIINLIAGIGVDIHRQVAALRHVDGAGGLHYPAVAGAGGDAVGDRRKAGADAVIALHVIKSIAVHRPHRHAVYQHVGNLVIYRRGDGKALPAAVGYRDVAGRRDAAVRPGHRHDGVGVDLKSGFDGVIGINVCKDIAAQRTGGNPVDQHIEHMVAGIGNDIKKLIIPPVDGHIAGRTDAAVGTGAGGDAEGLHLKTGFDGVIGSDVAEGVGGDISHRNAIHQYIGHLVSGRRGDGEGLIQSLEDLHLPYRRNAAVRSRRSGNGIGRRYRRRPHFQGQVIRPVMGVNVFAVADIPPGDGGKGIDPAAVAEHLEAVADRRLVAVGQADVQGAVEGGGVGHRQLVVFRAGSQSLQF